MKEQIKKEIEAILRYELAEGILYRDENGKLRHTTPEVLDIDPDIFLDLQSDE